ncbi:MAG: glucose-6-phosphate dehydrogenase [Candidatus Omnitrophica bacterium]|nr:glucose-6-phosphate dehydrogenase [Candidatus Omnitrophota bacterium]
MMEQLDELLICRLEDRHKAVEPCTVVIFGASGDLTARKLIPGFYHLYCQKQMPRPFRIVGFARRDKTDESWRDELKVAVKEYSRPQPGLIDAWDDFAANLFYCRGDMDDPSAYQRLAEFLAKADAPPLRQHLLFYLATRPSQFSEVSRHLNAAGLLRKEHSEDSWHRLVVEKPFGHDLNSALALNHELVKYAYEKQIFRIDHYLGKETVQNIFLFRFSNAIFEELWSRRTIDHVQITVSEHLGVGSRGGYYEEAGALRDMVQNHLLQVLALVAMEPPVSLQPEAIRDEKVKLLKAIRPLAPNQAAARVVRGQYAAGESQGKPMPAYRQEPKVSPDSNVETYVALKLFIDNWRWSGVPFYLRTGKWLPISASEVRVQFQPPPHVLFAQQCGPTLDANAIALRLQPDEGISLRFNGKIPGLSMELRPVTMHFSYDTEFRAYTPEAYERLLLDAMAGDPTLFIRADVVETAWRIVDPIRSAWADKPLSEDEFYKAGSWGPASADALLARDGRAWRNPHERG